MPFDRTIKVSLTEQLAKEQIMAREEVSRAAETAWTAAKRILLESVDDPSSALRAMAEAGGTDAAEAERLLARLFAREEAPGGRDEENDG